MSKKLMAIVVAMMLTLAMTTTAFAVSPTRSVNAGFGGCGKGYSQQCYTLMRDADGNLVSRDVFEKNLDEAIADGTFKSEDKEYFLERYDNCSKNGGALGGGRRCGGLGGFGCGYAVPNN